MGRALFLHHYLPAQTCNYLLLGAVFQFMFIDGVDSPVSRMEGMKPVHHNLVRMKSVLTQVSWAAAAVILIGQIAMFIFLSPLTYGTPGMDVAQVVQHKLLNSWDLQFGKLIQCSTSCSMADVHLHPLHSQINAKIYLRYPNKKLKRFELSTGY